MGQTKHGPGQNKYMLDGKNSLVVLKKRNNYWLALEKHTVTNSYWTNILLLTRS